MARHCHNHGLDLPLLRQEGPDLLCRLEAIEDRHANVHQNQAVAVAAARVGLLHLADCLLSVLCRVDDLLDVLELELLEHGDHCRDVEWLVVDDQEALVVALEGLEALKVTTFGWLLYLFEYWLLNYGLGVNYLII